jgi:hypothetical protein
MKKFSEIAKDDIHLAGENSKRKFTTLKHTTLTHSTLSIQ